MEENNLYSKTIDAVEIFSNSNLLLETNTQIQFNTPKLLINFIPFDEFIKNIVFQTDITQLTRDSANEIENQVSSSIDLTEAYENNATLTVDNVYCSNISANSSKVDISGTAKYHCVTLSTSNNLILRNTSDYTNIEYNSNNHLSSLSNYIYHILNETTFTEDDLTANASTLATARDISSFGTYFTNKIITSNVYTSDVGDSSGIESILGISSDSAVNLHIYQDTTLDADGLRNIASNIILGDDDTNLKDYIYSFLDETDLFHITITAQSGAEISFEYDQSALGNGFSNIKYGDMFSYDIEYTIEDVAYPGVIPPAGGVNSVDTLDIKFELTPTPPQVSQKFTGLTPGQFYNIYANVTNRLTNTLTENILVAENIPTIPPIEIVSIEIVSEYSLRITFTPHDIATVVQVVSFNAYINSVGSPIVEPHVSTGRTQNLNTTPPGNNFVFNYSLTRASIANSLINNYGNTFIRKDLDTIVSIINDPYRMVQSQTLSATTVDNTFNSPNPPRNLSISYSGSVYTFNWNFPSSSTNKKETKFKYNLYHDSTLKYTSPSYGTENNNTSVTSTSITISNPSITISNPINTGTWEVESINLYEYLSLSKSSITVTQPIITITSTDLIYNDALRQYKVLHHISDINGTASISGTITSGTRTSSTNIYTVFTFPSNTTTGSQDCNITVTDSLNLSHSDNKSVNLSVTFNSSTPTINLDIESGTCEIVFVPSLSPTNDSKYTYSWSSYLIAHSMQISVDAIDGAINTKKVIIKPATVTFSCTVTEENAQGFVKTDHPILTVSTTLPTLPVLNKVTSTFITLTIEWTSLGDNGTPPQDTYTLRIYYKKDSEPQDFDTDDYVDITPIVESGSKQITGLDFNSRYYYKLVKHYSFYGNRFISGDYTTRRPAIPDNPSALSATVHSMYINLIWTGGNNYADATNVTYTININGTDTITGLTTTNYLLTHRYNEGNIRMNTAYTIYIKKVYSLDDGGSGEIQSNSITRTTLSSPRPVIDNISSTSTYNSINLVWTNTDGISTNNTDGISTNNINYSIELGIMNRGSEGGTSTRSEGSINNISYTRNNYTITSYTGWTGRIYDIYPNTEYNVRITKNITYYSSDNIYNWRSDVEHITTPVELNLDKSVIVADDPDNNNSTKSSSTMICLVWTVGNNNSLTIDPTTPYTVNISSSVTDSPPPPYIIITENPSIAEETSVIMAIIGKGVKDTTTPGALIPNTEYTFTITKHASGGGSETSDPYTISTKNLPLQPIITQWEVRENQLFVEYTHNESYDHTLNLTTIGRWRPSFGWAVDMYFGGYIYGTISGTYNEEPPNTLREQYGNVTNLTKYDNTIIVYIEKIYDEVPKPYLYTREYGYLNRIHSDEISINLQPFLV